MKAVFLSDAHIRDHNDPNLPPLLGFLDYLKGQIDQLHIVGDFFDTWFGFPKAVFDEYVPLLGALDALKRSGARIVYVTGNHDFEMGHFFVNILGAEIHDTEMVLEADGVRAFVAHGDMVNEADRAYRRLRRVLRCRLTRWLGRRLPPSWVWRIAQRLSRRSSGGALTGHADLRDMFADYAVRKHSEGFEGVVLGHLHVPVFTETSGPNGPLTYANLGDWLEARTFLRWVDGSLALKQWVWPEGEEREYPGSGK